MTLQEIRDHLLEIQSKVMTPGTVQEDIREMVVDTISMVDKFSDEMRENFDRLKSNVAKLNELDKELGKHWDNFTDEVIGIVERAAKNG